MAAPLSISALIVLLTIPWHLKGEYRIYQYQVQSQERPAETFVAVSTLPPVSYQAYHGGSSIRADLINTWTCPGSTAKQDYCTSPLAQLSKDLAQTQGVLP